MKSALILAVILLGGGCEDGFEAGQQGNREDF